MTTKIFSILALIVLATSFAFSSPPPSAQSENTISVKTSTAKFPPGVNTLSAIDFSEAKFAVYAPTLTPFRSPNIPIGFLTPETFAHGDYRSRNFAADNLFRKPKDVYASEFDLPDRLLNVRPKPAIVRMM